jgi:hypothetical protein
MEVAMKASEIRDYQHRDWALVRESKARYWAEHKRSLSPGAALDVGDALREHARGLRPEWPDAAEREADLRVHTRVSESLRRVRSARR